MTLRVLANHAHVFPETIRPEGTVSRLLQLMDTCGIEQAVCFAPLAHQAPDLDVNGWLVEAIRGNPRLIPFGTINPQRPDLREQIARCADLGILGLKLHPNAQRFDILSPPLLEVYDEAQKRDMFITFHSGVHRAPLLENAVLRFDEIGWKFPNLRYSLEHVGGYHFFNEALAVIFNHRPPPWETGRCNVFAGLTSIFTTHYNRHWHLSDEQLRELALQAGVEQLIFGLDFPYNLEEETRIGLQTIARLFSPAEQELILGGNLRRELKLDR